MESILQGAHMKIGDIVKLKSSNILMTVEFIDKQDVNVVWFDDHQNLCRATFNIANLEIVSFT